MSIRKFDVGTSHPTAASARLLSITSSKFEEDWFSVPHTHPYTEIFYTKSGKGHMQIEDALIPLTPDMLVIINPHAKHTETSSKTDPLDYYVIGVEGIQVISDHSTDYSVIENADRTLLVRPCFENILDEMHNRQDYYLELSQDYMNILIRKIQRKLRFAPALSPPRNGTHECHKAKQYMDANYPKKITLDVLAKVSNLNKYYLSHCFTEIYGQSPISYLNQVRVEVCKDLLINTNMTIEDIAGSTGFSSRSYLAQVFQKTYGMTCQQYRKIYRKQ